MILIVAGWAWLHVVDAVPTCNGAGWDHSAVRRVLSWGHRDRESASGSPGGEPQYSSTGKPLVSVAPLSGTKLHAVSWWIRDWREPLSTATLKPS